jgi:protocatechuate 3,4-dioxygenase alpha subunit
MPEEETPMRPLQELYQRDRRLHPPALTPNYKTSVARSPRYALLSLQSSYSETTGPIFGHNDIGSLDNDLIRNYAHDGEPVGERIVVHGRVLDENGRPVPNTLVEFWQANADGIYPHPGDPRSGGVESGFRGWGRIISDFDTGLFAFETVKPGSAPGRAHMGKLRPASEEEQVDAHGRGHEGPRPMAPHLNLWIVARGINIGLNTRMYFADEDEANARDPVLNLIEQPDRRATLIAAREMRDGKPVYRFAIRLQGEGEMVFFDV